MRSGNAGRALAVGAAAAAIASGLAGRSGAGERDSTQAAADPVVAAVGDIACDPGDASYNGGAGTATACRQRYTSDLAVGAGLSAVLALGDLQYEDGTLAKFHESYDASWGRLKSITYPVPGNHEYGSPGAAGYFAYFGARAGDVTKGYYSFDLGSWHLVALNSECARVGGCGPGSPQLEWLLQDLKAHATTACTLAFWHTPRFSSGGHGSNAAYHSFWQALYARGADVVLAGHDHDYERFAPQTPAGGIDAARGIRQFVVGTGGRNLRPFGTVAANSEVRQSDTLGILQLTLHATSYEWRFVPEAGRTFADAGSAPCSRPPARTYVFRPGADGSVGLGRPAKAGAPLLLVGGTPGRHRSFVRFGVVGVRGTVADARLRLYVRDATPAQITVHPCSVNWREAHLATGRTPRILSPRLARARPLRRGRWLELRLPARAIPRNGSLCLALLSAGRDLAAFGSRESRTPPQLLLRTISAP